MSNDLERIQLIDGLRQLADWYEQHPDAPVPFVKRFTHCADGNDERGIAEVDRIGDLMGIHPSWSPGGTSYGVMRQFAGLKFEAFHVLDGEMRDYTLRQRIARAATPEQLATVQDSAGEHGLHSPGGAGAALGAAAPSARAAQSAAPSSPVAALPEGGQSGEGGPGYRCEGCGKTSRIVAHEPGCPVDAAWQEAMS